jgi:hypothetical protein
MRAGNCQAILHCHRPYRRCRERPLQDIYMRFPCDNPVGYEFPTKIVDGFDAYECLMFLVEEPVARTGFDSPCRGCQ